MFNTDLIVVVCSIFWKCLFTSRMKFHTLTLMQAQLMERTPSLSDLNEIVYGQVPSANINVFCHVNLAYICLPPSTFLSAPRRV